jgi:hypothetical protein
MSAVEINRIEPRPVRPDFEIELKLTYDEFLVFKTMVFRSSEVADFMQRGAILSEDQAKQLEAVLDQIHRCSPTVVVR